VDSIARVLSTTHEQGIKFVSKPDKNLHSQIVRDPDGHALELDQESEAVAQK
jgi:hypothetical protein